MPQPKYNRSSNDILINFIRAFGGRKVISLPEYRHWRGYKTSGHVPSLPKDFLLVTVDMPEAQKPDISHYFLNDFKWESRTITPACVAYVGPEDRWNYCATLAAQDDWWKK